MQADRADKKEDMAGMDRIIDKRRAIMKMRKYGQ